MTSAIKTILKPSAEAYEQPPQPNPSGISELFAELDKAFPNLDEESPPPLDWDDLPMDPPAEPDKPQAA